MMYTGVYGRLGKDAQEIKTRTGNRMADFSPTRMVGERICATKHAVVRSTPR
jgi:hypothetical protein